MEGGGLFFTESTKFAGAVLDYGGRHVIQKGGGAGAGAERVGKNVKVGERTRFDEIHGDGMVVFGFAGEARDYIGAYGGVRQLFVNEVNAAGVVFQAVPAMHGGQNSVGGRLQRHVEVFGE